MDVDEIKKKLAKMEDEGNNTAATLKHMLEHSEGLAQERLLADLTKGLQIIEIFESNINKPSFRKDLANALRKK